MFIVGNVLLQSSSSKSLLKYIRHFRYASTTQFPTMERKPILYGDLVSPPVRFVMMTASVLGVDLDFHKVDLFCGENKTEFFKKINPLQKVPVLAVGKEVIKESHAIALYLCQIAERQDLYPQDALEKARVNQMLFFNSSSLFQLDAKIFTDFFAGKWPVDEQSVEEWNCLLDYLENRLEQNTWLAGEKMSLGDISCLSTVSSLQLLIPSLNRHKKLHQWAKRLQDLPCFKINEEGLKRLSGFVNLCKK